jgi:hypothetical protein
MGISPAILNSVDNVANIVNSSVANISDAISEQQQQLDCESERQANVRLLSVLQQQSAPESLTGCHQSISFFATQIFPMSGSQELEDGYLRIPSFESGQMGQEELSGAAEFVRGLHSSFTSTSDSSTYIAGAGKTVLACVPHQFTVHLIIILTRSMVVDHLAAKFQNDDIGVACMYLNHKEAEEQTPGKLLAGLWRQLVLGKDIGTAEGLYQRHCEKRTTPSLDEVFNILSSVIAKYSKVHIIVDAIDEYIEAQRQILVKYLAIMSPTINLMITSRPHITPDGCLPNLNSLEIRANEDDVRRYVDAQISLSSRLSKHVQNRTDLREEIDSKIIRTVDGM